MRLLSDVRIKICCIGSVNEARRVIGAGADAIGLVGAMPSGPGVISDDAAREIALAVPPPIASFLLTSRTDGAGIAAHLADVPANTIQVVSHIEPDEWKTVAREHPGVRRVQVIHVEDEHCIELVQRYEQFVHGFLLDSGRPTADIAELGGTGRTHDWSISSKIVNASSVPVFLAGGLGPGNVGDAINHVRPFGVDVCSGVRTNGELDDIKLMTFVQQVRQASA